MINNLNLEEIDALVLDFGGVVFLPKHIAVINFIKNTFSLEDKKDYDGNKIWDKCAVNNPFLKVEFWQEYATNIGLKKEIGNQLHNIFFESNLLFPETEELIKKAKKQGKKIYYLTNTKPKIFDSRNSSYILDYFDGGLTDLEAGVSKPDPKIYQILIQKFNLIPEKTLYLDDKLENIETGKKLGFKSILYSTCLNIST